MAAGVPLLLGLTAVMATLGLVAPLSQIVPMDDAASSVILLVGLAVGVDYSMFYLRRKMEERDAGRSSEAALEFAAATSGQAVVISGLTVMIAMAGMFFAGSVVFTGFAVGTILVVGVAVLGSRHRAPRRAVQARRQGGVGPRAGHRPHAPPQPRRVARVELDPGPRPAAPGRRARAGRPLLIALAIPALSMKTVNPGASGLPKDLEVMQVYDRIQAAFPGGPLPALVAVQADDVTKPEVVRPASTR